MSRYIDADLMREKAYQMNFGGRINERELFLFNRALSEMPTVDAVPVDFIEALHTDYVQRSKALQGRTGYMYTLYAIALENLMQSFDYDNAMANEMKTERNCADGGRRTE